MKSTSSIDKRIEWLDVVRSIAIVCVVINHAAERTYTLSMNGIGLSSINTQLLALTLFTFGRLGVPIFLMMSGYLLLDRKWDKDKTLSFWKRNWFGLLLSTEIWFIIYDVFLALFQHKALNVTDLIFNLLFLKKVDLYHVWYMPMILGMYILIPMVGISLQKFPPRILCFPIIIFSLYSFGYPIFNLLVRAIGDSSQLQFSLGFSGGAYGLYLIFGYLIRKNVFQKVHKFTLSLVTVVAFVLTVSFQLCSYILNHPYNVWYDNGFLMVSSVSLMILFSKSYTISKVGENVSRFTAKLAKDSFGIYLVHVPIMEIIKARITLGKEYDFINFLILTIVVLILSWVIVDVSSRVPKIGKILYSIK